MVNKSCLPFLTLCAVETTQCCEARLPQRSAMAAHEARKVPKQITRSLAILLFLTRTMRKEHSNEAEGRFKVFCLFRVSFIDKGGSRLHTALVFHYMMMFHCLT